MRVEWFGQSAFALSAPEATVFIDPFDEMSRPAAIGAVDLVFLPVGGGLTIGAEGAAAIVAELGPRWAVPMHYRTHRTSFLETEGGLFPAVP
jgi:L-ascorbate metabolism protein UlaG (beta-lactamase superfamily)